MDYFQALRKNMEAHYGQDALKHPHPGFIGRISHGAAAASILPPLSDFNHINKPYETPVVAYEEVLPPTVDMEVDEK
jgi:hypothetical protein